MCLGLAAGYREPKKKRIIEHNRIHSKNEPNAYYITKALNIAVEALNKQTPQKPISFEATSK